VETKLGNDEGIIATNIIFSILLLLLSFGLSSFYVIQCYKKNSFCGK